MWFMFPEGTKSISIEQQEYGIEATDSEGRNYFRAPDHFAAIVLSLPNFRAVASPPEGAPEDLPKADPVRDNAITSLTHEVGELRSALERSKAETLKAQGENQRLSSEIERLKEELKETRADLADAQAPKPFSGKK